MAGAFSWPGSFLPSRAHPLRQNLGASVIRELACAGIADRRYPGQAFRASGLSPAPERPTVGNRADLLRGNRRPSVLTLPHSGAGRGSGYRRSPIPAQRTVRITDAPGFPRSMAPGLPTLPHSRASLHRPPARNPHTYRRSPFSAQASQRQPRALNLALLSNLPRHRQSAASIPSAFRKRKLTISCFSIDSLRGLPKVGPWIS